MRYTATGRRAERRSAATASCARPSRRVGAGELLGCVLAECDPKDDAMLWSRARCRM